MVTEGLRLGLIAYNPAVLFKASIEAVCKKVGKKVFLGSTMGMEKLLGWKNFSGRCTVIPAT